MSDELDETIDSTNDTTEEVDNTDDVEETVVDTETEDDTGSESTDEDLEVLKERNRKLFERAKKAEAEAKALKIKTQTKAEPKPKPSEKQDGITAMDAMVLMSAKVTEAEDITEVADYAKFKGISIAEALQTSAIKSILAERAEQRQTASATNTGAARRGTTQASPEQILANAEKGILPDSPEALAEARWTAKLKK